MDFDSLQDDSVAATPAAAPANTVSGSAKAKPLSFDDLPDDKEKYGTPFQQALSGYEATAQGFLSKPVVTAAELGLHKISQKLGFSPIPGLNPEDLSPEAIAGREEANPWTHGIGTAVGLGVGMLGGTGEAQVLAKAGQLGAKALGLGEAANFGSKIGSMAIKGFIENGLLQTGDEISNQMLGKGDPEAPVASALSHIGAAGLFGGGIGGGLGTLGFGTSKALKGIADTKAGNALGQWLEDFGNRWKFKQENPNMVDAIYKELNDFHAGTSDAASEVYGSEGLKNQAIESLTNTVKPEQVELHIAKVNSMLEDAPKAIKNNDLFREAVAQYAQESSSGNAADVFKATENLKRQMQEWGQYNKQFVPLSEVPFRKCC